MPYFKAIGGFYRQPAICVLLALLLGGLDSANAGIFSGGKSTRVFVDSLATEKYQNRPNKGEPETCHFYKGRYFGGYINDKSLERVSFEEIVTVLVKEMKAKNYYAESDPTKGDLFIVVHWGITAVEEDFEELFGEDTLLDNSDSDFDDTDDLSDRDDSSDFGPTRSAPSQRNSAAILGYNRALRSKGLTAQQEYELRMELEEERYFIILMAYDHQKLLKDKTLDLLWTTRFSLRGIGTNFEDAYHALSRGAAPFYGENLKDLTRVRTHLGQGDIELGELEVLEIDADTEE